MRRYSAFIERIIDADTVIARIQLGMNVQITQKVRLAGIDAHEKNTFLGLRAMAYVQQQLLCRLVELDVPPHPFDKYARVLATLWVNGENFNQTLIDQGYARVYNGHPPARIKG